MKTYICNKCGKRHLFNSVEGMKHLPANLKLSDIENAIDLSFSAGSYSYITANSQQYLRDISVFEILKDKFNNAGMFASKDSAKEWLNNILNTNPVNHNLLLMRLEGHSAGEVDALRHFNSQISSLFYKTEFVGNAGHTPANFPGVDLQQVNRFSGKVVEYIQVKSNWSTNPAVLKQTIEDFLHNAKYNPDITLAAPKEVIAIAKEMGVPNKLVTVNDVAGNRLSGERIQELIQNKSSAVDGTITLQGVAERVGQGVIVGAAVAAGVSSLGNIIAYRQGHISGKETITRIGVDASKGAVVGGAMGGLSLLFPPGAIGIGIGIAVGMQVRRIVDIAYGKGAYVDIVRSMGAVEASTKMTADGVAVIAQSVSYSESVQKEVIKELNEFAESSYDTDKHLNRLELFREDATPHEYED